jgi:hypothetical protein
MTGMDIIAGFIYLNAFLNHVTFVHASWTCLSHDFRCLEGACSPVRTDFCRSVEPLHRSAEAASIRET